MSLIFLMCSERSGSNFITKFLNGHSNICGPSTKHLINPVARNLFRYADLTKEKNWRALIDDISNLIAVDFSVWKRKFSPEDLWELAKTGDISSLIKNIFLEEAKANNKQYVFVKENQLYEFLPFLLINFPEAKYVYQVRDPRDMALSWKKNPSHRGGVIAAARQWKHDQQQYLKIYHLLKALDKAHKVSYEELLRNPKDEITSILKFLGLPFEDLIFDFHKDEITEQNAGMQDAWKNISRGVIRENAGKYKFDLSEQEIKAIEKICFYEMTILDYQPRYNFADLSLIQERELDQLNEYEERSIQYKPNDRIIANMDAKSVFYRKQI